jgi:hypothetical protein
MTEARSREDIRADFAVILDRYIWRKAVTDNIRLYHDLWLSGDDAFELLEDVQKKFGTSFRAMDFNIYFPYEGENYGAWLLSRLGFPPTKFRAVTVGHMLDVIARGAWFDPPC